MITARKPLPRVAIALASAAACSLLALTGCSAGAPAQSAPAPSAPAATTDTSTAPSAPATTEASTSDTSGKPSKDDVVAGLTNFYTSTQGMPKDKAKKFAECMMDEMYDKASVQTLNAMKDGKPTSMDTADAKLLTDAGVACAKAIA